MSELGNPYAVNGYLSIKIQNLIGASCVTPITQTVAVLFDVVVLCTIAEPSMHTFWLVEDTFLTLKGYENGQLYKTNRVTPPPATCML